MMEESVELDEAKAEFQFSDKATATKIHAGSFTGKTRIIDRNE